MERARLAVLPDADCEVSYVAEFVRAHDDVVVIAPDVYDSIFRSWNIAHGESLFAVPSLVIESFGARALLGAFGLARQQFQRQSVWNYMHSYSNQDVAALQRELRTTGKLPDAVRTLLGKVVALMSPKPQTVASYIEASESFLRNSLGVESDRLFEILYEHSDDEAECTRDEYVRSLREWLNRIEPGKGTIEVRRNGKDVAKVVVVGCYESAEHVTADLLANAELVSIPLVTPDSRQVTYPHHQLIHELKVNNPSISTSNFLQELPNDAEVFLSAVDWLSRTNSQVDVSAQVAVLESRTGDDFSAFDGNLAGAVDLGIPRPTYVSFLNNYTACPLQTFFDHELQIAVDDDPDETIGIAPVDRGVLVHEILHRFFLSTTPRETPEEKWTNEERQQFTETIDVVVAEFRDKVGDASATAFWIAEEQTVRLLLATFLDDDEKFREENAVIPAHQEVWFGGVHDQIPAVAMANGEVEIALRGRVDRIDQSLDGDRIIVTDYKTGNASYAPSFRDGPIQDGELQLPIYAEAVQKIASDANISAQQWYVLDAKRARPSFSYDSNVRDELQNELLTIANDYKSGWFPAHPGDELPWGYTNCQHCPYDRVCPADRGDAYERKVGEQ